MMKVFAFLVLVVTGNCLARPIFEVGDVPGNSCWRTVACSTCLDDHKDKIRVLLFNAGWCAPCQREFKELVPMAEEFAGKDVVFISLSADGFKHGELGDPFLKAWAAKFGIHVTTKANWEVAESPKDFGLSYFQTGVIPNVAIIGKDGKLKWKATAPGAKAIVSVVRSLLK